MPPTDLANVANPTLTAMIQSLSASPEMIRCMSVARHRTRNPVLAQIARDDVLIDPAQTKAWAKSDPRVRAQIVEGTHIYPPTPEQRAAQVQSAMAYLARLRQAMPIGCCRGKESGASPLRSPNVGGTVSDDINRPR
jgi:hypothetical protein